jgi:hypothetical protein
MHRTAIAATLALALTVLAGAAAAQSEYWRTEWPETDFSVHSVPLTEILSGGPPRDGIPALDHPAFVPVAGKAGLDAREPVMVLDLDGAPARAYPLRYLTWHEIVNDTVAGVPVAVTFCPLCNSGIVFDRRLGGRTLGFGVTGKLRNSDMIMYDRETASWWQQALGEAIVGTLTGQRLAPVPAWTESWAGFRAAHPDGLVMAEPALDRPYGRNPYVGYDSAAQPFLYDGAAPPHGIAPLARVVRVGSRAWPLSRLAEAGRLSEAGVTLTWRAGVASALDTARIGQGREVGAIRVTDAQGRDLAHDLMFAFAFHAFHPEGEWMLGR